MTTLTPWKRALAATLLAGCILPAHAGLLEDGYLARYAVSKGGLPLGESVRVLRPLADGGWSFSARAVPTGLAAVLFGDVIEERSEIRPRSDGAVPLSYSYHQHGGRKEKAYALRFDWSAGALHFDHNGLDLPLPPRAQDPLSFTVAVMQHLAVGERTFGMTIAGRNKLRDYRVTVAGEAQMATVLGRQAVVHVKAQEVGKDTHYDLWCLPGHDYLPLRIRQVRKDEVTELRLRELVSPPPAEGTP